MVNRARSISSSPAERRAIYVVRRLAAESRGPRRAAARIELERIAKDDPSDVVRTEARIKLVQIGAWPYSRPRGVVRVLREKQTQESKLR